MIYVIATIEVVDGRRDDFVAAFRENVPNVLAEDGCIEYEPTVDLETEIPAQPDERSSVVTIVEKWDSLEALQAHLIAPHMLSFRKTVKDLVAGVSLQVLQPA